MVGATGPTLSTLTRTPKKSYALDPTAFVTPLRTLTLARLWESLLPYTLDPRGAAPSKSLPSEPTLNKRSVAVLEVLSTLTRCPKKSSTVDPTAFPTPTSTPTTPPTTSLTPSGSTSPAVRPTPTVLPALTARRSGPATLPTTLVPTLSGTSCRCPTTSLLSTISSAVLRRMGWITNIYFQKFPFVLATRGKGRTEIFWKIVLLKLSILVQLSLQAMRLVTPTSMMSTVARLSIQPGPVLKLKVSVQWAQSVVVKLSSQILLLRRMCAILPHTFVFGAWCGPE